MAIFRYNKFFFNIFPNIEIFLEAHFGKIIEELRVFWSDCFRHNPNNQTYSVRFPNHIGTKIDILIPKK